MAVKSKGNTCMKLGCQGCDIRKEQMLFKKAFHSYHLKRRYLKK